MTPRTPYKPTALYPHRHCKIMHRLIWVLASSPPVILAVRMLPEIIGPILVGAVVGLGLAYFTCRIEEEMESMPGKAWGQFKIWLAGALPGKPVVVRPFFVYASAVLDVVTAATCVAVAALAVFASTGWWLADGGWGSLLIIAWFFFPCLAAVEHWRAVDRQGIWNR